MGSIKELDPFGSYEREVNNAFTRLSYVRSNHPDSAVPSNSQNAV